MVHIHRGGMIEALFKFFSVCYLSVVQLEYILLISLQVHWFSALSSLLYYWAYSAHFSFWLLYFSWHHNSHLIYFNNFYLFSEIFHLLVSSESVNDCWNIFFFFWPHRKACGILVPWPGIEPVPAALEVWSLNHWKAREVPEAFLWYLL